MPTASKRLQVPWALHLSGNGRAQLTTVLFTPKSNPAPMARPFPEVPLCFSHELFLDVDWACNSRTVFLFQYGVLLKAVCGVGEATREYSAAKKERVSGLSRLLLEIRSLRKS